MMEEKEEEEQEEEEEGEGDDYDCGAVVNAPAMVALLSLLIQSVLVVEI